MQCPESGAPKGTAGSCQLPNEEKKFQNPFILVLKAIVKPPVHTFVIVNCTIFPFLESCAHSAASTHSPISPIKWWTGFWKWIFFYFCQISLSQNGKNLGKKWTKAAFLALISGRKNLILETWSITTYSQLHITKFFVKVFQYINIKLLKEGWFIEWAILE